MPDAGMLVDTGWREYCKQYCRGEAVLLDRLPAPGNNQEKKWSPNLSLVGNRFGLYWPRRMVKINIPSR